MKSMTGYGRATARTERYEITAEVHSVNHRYLETSVRLPRSFSYLEGKIKEQVQQAVSRGKVEVALTMQSIGSKDTTVEINHDVVMAYLRAVAAENELLRESGLPKNQIVLGTAGSESGGATDALPLSTLLRIPDAFQVQQVAEDADVIWSEVQPVVTEALQQFVTMRQTEGERLAADVASHLENLESMTNRVEQLVPETVQQYYDKLYKKITELLGDRTVEESRLVTETAVVAEKIAVDEELVRLHSHIAQFRGFLESTEPTGRKMDFLVQEMNREVNTTGSKSQSLEITKLVVDMKSEIEKIREQIRIKSKRIFIPFIRSESIQPSEYINRFTLIIYLFFKAYKWNLINSHTCICIFLCLHRLIQQAHFPIQVLIRIHRTYLM